MKSGQPSGTDSKAAAKRDPFWRVSFLILIGLLICVFSCRYFVLPGTESCQGNKNYKFHFIGFLKGFVTRSMIAAVISLLTYGIRLLLK